MRIVVYTHYGSAMGRNDSEGQAVNIIDANARADAAIRAFWQAIAQGHEALAMAHKSMDSATAHLNAAEDILDRCELRLQEMRP